MLSPPHITCLLTPGAHLPGERPAQIVLCAPQCPVVPHSQSVPELSHDGPPNIGSEDRRSYVRCITPSVSQSRAVAVSQSRCSLTTAPHASRRGKLLVIRSRPARSPAKLAPHATEGGVPASCAVSNEYTPHRIAAGTRTCASPPVPYIVRAARRAVALVSENSTGRRCTYECRSSPIL